MSHGRSAVAIILLTAIASATPRTGVADQAKPSFVVACKTTAADSVFPHGTVLALVHMVGTTTSILYQLNGDNIATLAELHFSGSDTEEFVEAQGGVESTAIASDVISSLRRLPFVLSDGDWQSAVRATHRQCKVRYSLLKRYRERSQAIR